MFKKVFNLFLISLLCMGNFFILPIKNIRAAGSDIRINEAASSEAGGRDWIEFYVAEDGDYSGYVVKERTTEIKSFPSDFNLETGDYVVLHLSQTETETDENNATGKGENDYWDLFSTDSGLTGTDNVITIEDEYEHVVDSLCFSNMDEGLTYSSTFKRAVLNSILTNQWNTPAGPEDQDYISISANWSEGNDGYSLGRDIGSNDTDNGGIAADDWSLKEYQTMGFANRENLEPEIESVEADPNSFVLGEEDLILFKTNVYDEDGLEDIASVNIDISDLGGEIQEIYNDGINGDEVALDSTYSYEYNLSDDINFGNYEVTISVTDSAFHEIEDSVEIEILEPEYSDDILLNEILPNPVGSDSEGEFIELYNSSSEDVNLENWQIGDSSSTYTISSDDLASTIITAHSYFTIYRDVSGISLNNTGGETINLFQPNENLLDAVAYSESALEGQSYNLLNSSWEWSIEITPGDANQIVHENHNPEAQAGSDIEAEIDEKITFDGSGSSDPDSDTLSYKWDFGDGNRGAGSKTNHTYSKEGSYTVELTISDGQGGEDSDTLKVKVVEPDIESDTTLSSNSNSSTDSSSDSEESISGPFSEDIIITEVLPNPEGSDTVDEGEFIEIFNKGKEDIDLESWQIDDEDGGSSPHTIENKVIKAGEYLVFYRGETKLSLNNSDEKARLLHPNDDIVSEVYYEDKAEDGYSYALDNDNNWRWTSTPTPGEENNISQEGEVDDEDSENNDNDEGSSATSTNTNDASKDNNEESNEEVNIISIKEAREKEKNSEVKVKGIVTSEPGLFSKKTFYIQDANAGIQIYFSKEDFPKLELGDEVTVFGKRSESGNEKKINISDKEDIQVLGHKTPPQPKEIKTGDLKEDYEGQLVKVTGEIVKTSGNVFYLDDSSGQAKIYINKNTGINKPEFRKGDKMTILGIESETSSGYRVLPRYQSDIRDGEGGILAGVNKITGNIPQAGANTMLLFVFSLFITFYIYLPQWIYRLKNS